MVDYTISETSVHDAKPVELFKFVGTYDSFFYTSGPVPVPFDGDTYVPIAIRRSDVVAGTQDDDGLDLTIEMPVSSEMVQTYAFSVAPPSLIVTIYRYHRGSASEFVAYWVGPVNNIHVTGGIAKLRSPSLLASALNTAVPNVYFQSPCNHTLYDGRCGIVEASFSQATTVSTVDSISVTVASIGSLDGKLVGGELRNTLGERRMIMAQTGTALEVNYPFNDLAASDSVTIVAGCDHAYSGDCLSVFNNQGRFGGFPFIPPDNIFEEGMEPGQVITDNTCLPTVTHGDEPEPPEPPVFEGWYAMAIIELVNPSVSLASSLGWILGVSGAVNQIDKPDVGDTWPGGIEKAVYGSGNNSVTLLFNDPDVMTSTELHLTLQFPSGTVDSDMRARLYWQLWDGAGAYRSPKASSTVIDPGDPSWSFGDPFDVRSTFPSEWYFNA